MLIKGHLDKTLFGWINHMVEYVYKYDKDVLAMRVGKAKQNEKYVLEIMRMINSEKKMADIEWSIIEMPLLDSIPADKMATLCEFSALTAKKKYHDRSANEVMKDILRNMVYIRGGEPPFSSETPADSIISFAEFKEAVEYRNSQLTRNSLRSRIYMQYHPDSKSFEVSEEFALALHDEIMRLIRDFKSVREGETRPVMYNSDFLGGKSATFRCVVGDELWSLKVHEPQNGVLEMSNLLNMMITDAEAGQPIDEAKYIKSLREIKL